MDGWMDEQMDGQTDGKTDGQTNGWIDGWIDRWGKERVCSTVCIPLFTVYLCVQFDIRDVSP